MSHPYSEPTVPTDQDALLAREASRILNESGVGQQALRVRLVEADREGTIVELPAPAAKLLKELLKEMASGHAMTLVPIKAEITTRQTADILGVSRPFVVGLIDKGVLPARMVGAHRRLLLKDVLIYKAESKAKARAALKEMVAIGQELDLE